MQQAESEIKRAKSVERARSVLKSSVPFNTICVIKAGDLMLQCSPPSEGLPIPVENVKLPLELEATELKTPSLQGSQKEFVLLTTGDPQPDAEPKEASVVRWSLTGNMLSVLDIEKFVRELVWNIINVEVLEREGLSLRSNKFPTSASEPILFSDSMFTKEDLEIRNSTVIGSSLTALMHKVCLVEGIFGAKNTK